MSSASYEASPARLRVLQLCGAFGLGGTEQSIEVRSALLDPRWFDVHVVGVHGGPRYDRLVARALSAEVLGGKLEELARVLHERRPHVLHYARSERECSYSQVVQRLCRAAGVPALLETNVFGRPPGWAQERAPDFTCHVSLASMLRCARLSAQSLPSLFSQGHRTVYDAVPTAQGYGAVHAEREASRRALGIGPGTVLACRIARPDLRKWSIRLELALPKLFRAVPALRFALMAAPPEKAELLKRRHGDRVLCLEPDVSLQRLATVYAASDFMLHSSAIGESFGLAVAEGMSHGLPVIVDSTPDMDNAQVELVEHGVTGLVVASSRGFVAAARELANDAERRTRMGEAGQRRIATRFADHVAVAQWQRLYAEACERTGIPLAPGLKEHLAAHPVVPAQDEYAAFAEAFPLREQRYLGPPPGLSERTVGGLLRARDTLAYARRLGAKQVLRVVRSRLRASGSLARN